MKNFKNIALIATIYSGLLIGCGGNSSGSVETEPQNKEVLKPITKQEVPHMENSTGSKIEQDDSVLQPTQNSKQEAPHLEDASSNSKDAPPITPNKEVETP